MSPSPEHTEYAQVPLSRAHEDLHACHVLAEAANIGDSTVGLHAQQAVEKALKAVLVLAEIELPRTHDLELLVERAETSGIEVPPELADVAWLTPWAGPLRYDEPVPLDRNVALAVAESACSWATGRLSGA